MYVRLSSQSVVGRIKFQVGERKRKSGREKGLSVPGRHTGKLVQKDLAGWGGLKVKKNGKKKKKSR